MKIGKYKQFFLVIAIASFLNIYSGGPEGEELQEGELGLGSGPIPKRLPNEEEQEEYARTHRDHAMPSTRKLPSGGVIEVYKPEGGSSQGREKGGVSQLPARQGDGEDYAEHDEDDPTISMGDGLEITEQQEELPRTQKIEKFSKGLKELTRLCDQLPVELRVKYLQLIRTKNILEKTYTQIKNNLKELNTQEFDQIFDAFDEFRDRLTTIAKNVSFAGINGETEAPVLDAIEEELKAFEGSLKDAGRSPEERKKDIEKAYTFLEQGVGEIYSVGEQVFPEDDFVSIDNQYKKLTENELFKRLPLSIKATLRELYNNYSRLKIVDTGTLESDFSAVLSRVEREINKSLTLSKRLEKDLSDLLAKQNDFLKPVSRLQRIRNSALFKSISSAMSKIVNNDFSIIKQLRSVGESVLLFARSQGRNLRFTTTYFVYKVQQQAEKLVAAGKMVRFVEIVQNKMSSLSRAFSKTGASAVVTAVVEQDLRGAPVVALQVGDQGVVSLGMLEVAVAGEDVQDAITGILDAAGERYSPEKIKNLGERLREALDQRVLEMAVSEQDGPEGQQQVEDLQSSEEDDEEDDLEEDWGDEEGDPEDLSEDVVSIGTVKKSLRDLDQLLDEYHQADENGRITMDQLRENTQLSRGFLKVHPEMKWKIGRLGMLDVDIDATRGLDSALLTQGIYVNKEGMTLNKNGFPIKIISGTTDEEYQAIRSAPQVVEVPSVQVSVAPKKERPAVAPKPLKKDTLSTVRSGDSQPVVAQKPVVQVTPISGSKPPLLPKPTGFGMKAGLQASGARPALPRKPTQAELVARAVKK